MLPFKFRMSEPLHNIIIIRNPPKFSSFGCRWKLCLVKCSCTGMCDVRVLSKTRTLGCLWPQWSPKETIPTTACTNPMPPKQQRHTMLVARLGWPSAGTLWLRRRRPGTDIGLQISSVAFHVFRHLADSSNLSSVVLKPGPVRPERD